MDRGLHAGGMRTLPRDRQTLRPGRMGRVRLLRQSQPLLLGTAAAPGVHRSGASRRVRTDRLQGRQRETLLDLFSAEPGLVAAAIWHNDHTRQPVLRSLTAHDHRPLGIDHLVAAPQSLRALPLLGGGGGIRATEPPSSSTRACASGVRRHERLLQNFGPFLGGTAAARRRKPVSAGLPKPSHPCSQEPRDSRETSSDQQKDPPGGGSGVSAPGRTRTCGQVLRRHLLYPLSYGGRAVDVDHGPRTRIGVRVPRPGCFTSVARCGGSVKRSR